jgi:hypothetical protein
MWWYVLRAQLLRRPTQEDHWSLGIGDHSENLSQKHKKRLFKSPFWLLYVKFTILIGPICN